MVLIMSFVHAERKVMKIIISWRQSSAHRCPNEIRAEAIQSKIVCSPSVWSVDVNNAARLRFDVHRLSDCYTTRISRTRTIFSIIHMHFSFLLFLLSVEFDWVMKTNCSLEWFNCNVRAHFIFPVLIYRARFDRIDHLCFLFRNDIVSDACISNEKLWIKKGEIDRKISLMDNFVSD